MSPQAAQTAPSAVVVGMGRTGLSVARHLHRSGFRIAVTDSRAAPPEFEGVRALGPQVVTRTGGFDPQLLERADIVVTSPGVPLDDPFFVQARARGLDIVGDIELFARAADAPFTPPSNPPMMAPTAPPAAPRPTSSRMPPLSIACVTVPRIA